MTESRDAIDHVLLIPLTPHPDDRGSFTEVYRREWLGGGSEMVQGNLSISKANVLRGLHFHREQADYWVVLRGRAFVALYDLREGSPTHGRKQEIAIDADDRRFGLYIPRGIAHGFYAETEICLQYLVDRYFTGADEFGIAWDDRDLGIHWPATDPILSERDRSNPRLANVAPLPPYQRALT